jgi:pyruvate/2-oxoglutarate dehydrogenase complex dihydrolipoamide dehydrogenase (E3) component
MTFAKAGRKVAVIERGPLGGVCVNFGCTPTKTMVASARVSYLARRAAEYGVRTGPVSVDLQAVRKRKQGLVEGARNNFESGVTAVQELDLDLIKGEAHFIAPKTLGVSRANGETREITAPRARRFSCGSLPPIGSRAAIAASFRISVACPHNCNHDRMGE